MNLKAIILSLVGAGLIASGIAWSGAGRDAE